MLVSTCFVHPQVKADVNAAVPHCTSVTPVPILVMNGDSMEALGYCQLMAFLVSTWAVTIISTWAKNADP